MIKADARLVDRVERQLAGAIGKPQAHELMEELTKQALAHGRSLDDVVTEAVRHDEQLNARLELTTLRALFDPRVANANAAELARAQTKSLRQALAST